MLSLSKGYSLNMINAKKKILKMNQCTDKSKTWNILNPATTVQIYSYRTEEMDY